MIDAVNFAHERPELLRNMGLMYKEIAKKYKISPAKVQWSIRSSIDIMNRYISSDLSHTIFHVYAHENITPKFFLTIINDYLNNK